MGFPHFFILVVERFMNTADIRQKVYDMALQTAEDLGLELVGVDLSGKGRRVLLRVFVDKEGGVTIGDCERMSRSLEALLDVEDPIKGPYVLEVSSPGLDRPLIKQRDFDRAVGRLVRIVLSEKIDNQTFFIGRIIDVGEGWIRLKIEKKNEKDIYIPFNKISRANLEIEF